MKNKGVGLVSRAGRGLGLLAALVILSALLSKPVLADISACSSATGGISGTGRGANMTGTIGGNTYNVWGGVIFLDLTGTPNDTVAFCIDLTRRTGVGDCFNAGAGLTGNLAKALYYYPPDNSLSDTENAARQAVAWQFSDNFTPTSPSDVVTRYNAILTDLASQPAPPSNNAPIMTLTPASSNRNTGETQPFTITVTKDSAPVSNQVVNLTLTGVGTLSANSVTTDASGQATFTVSSSSYGSSSVSAKFSYSLPKGTQFDPVVAGKQKLVLGQTTTGDVAQNASITWRSPTAVTLASFTGKALAKTIRLRWQTGAQTNLIGFNVWRQTGKGGWQKINANVIPIDNPNNAAGAVYTYTDNQVQAPKTYKYKLEILELNAATEWSKPIRVAFK